MDGDLRHRPGTPGYRRLNAAMVAAGLAAFGILYAAQPLLPIIAADLDVSASRASLTVSGATGALALAVVPMTAAATRLGRVPAMRASLLGATALTAVAAAAPTFGSLVGLRVAAGLALAAVAAVAMGHVGSQVHPRGLGAAMGLFVAGNSLGGVTGRLVASVAGDLGSWRAALLAVAAVSAAATAVFWWLLPTPVPPPDPDAEAPGAPGARGATGGPQPRRRAWPTVAALTMVPFVTMGGFVALYNYLAFRLVAPPFGLPAAVVGLVFLAYLVGAGTSVVTGRLADRFGRAPVTLVAVAAMATGLLITLPDALVTVVLGLLVFTAGFFGVHAATSGWVQAVARRVGSRAGDRAGAAYVMAYYGGSGLFGTLVGVAWERADWPGVVGAVGALVLVGGLAVAVAAVRERRARPT